MPDQKATAPATAPSPIDRLAGMVESLVKSQQELMSRLQGVEDIIAAQPTAPAPAVHGGAPAKKPWEEVIWVEALQDCTYPDPGDPLEYGVYRKAAINDKPADIFRLKHREHLAKHLRELTPGEVQAARAPAKVIPQTAQRATRTVPAFV